MRGVSLPPQIIIGTYTTRASSPGRAASVDEGSARSFREFEAGGANDANGASGGSIESGGAVAGSSAGAVVEDVDME
jgi:hypothetical protein